MSVAPKFRHGQLVKTNENWQGEEVLAIIIEKDGDRYSKGKSGIDKFETHSYIAVDATGKKYYFLENEIK